MLLKKEEFWKRLEKGQIDPAYFFYGQEGFLIREAIEKVESAFLGPEATPFQRHHMHGDEFSTEELIELASTLTFGKAKRVITYHMMGRIKASDRDLIFSYMDRPIKETLLILNAPDTDVNAAFLKGMKEKAVVVRFYPLFKNQIPDWIRKHANQIGVQISPGAAELLDEVVGTDLALLSNEIQKLALYLQPKKRIDIKDIEKAVGKVRIFSIFELTKSLGEKKAGHSLKILRQLLEAGQSPVGIISLIAHHFRKLHLIKELVAQGKSQKEMAPVLGISPTFLTEFLQQAQLFTLDEIVSVSTLFLETDLQLKSSSLSQDLVLESLIFRICTSSSPTFAVSGD